MEGVRDLNRGILDVLTLGFAWLIVVCASQNGRGRVLSSGFSSSWGIAFGGERVSTDGALRAITVVNSDTDAKRGKSAHPNEYEAGARRAHWFCC